jgi:serine/threonine protein kinase
MLTVGKKFGPYEIDQELGSGSMGTVYRGRNLETGEKVAIKVIAPGLGANETALARFEREMEVLKQLRHPNIVRLIATGRYRKVVPFYVMEYIQGESLDRVLQRKTLFSWEEVVELGRQLCAALRHAHDKNIIHRDLKPSNLMVTTDGTVKLTDFGIAKDLDLTALTGANCTVGTAAYMSPEQCRGERTLSHKSDLYSLGVVFYELLTGEKPFKRQTTMDMFMAHVNEPPPRPSKVAADIPVWLDNLVVQLLEKKPDQRPFDAVMVGHSLKEVAERVEAWTTPT